MVSSSDAEPRRAANAEASSSVGGGQSAGPSTTAPSESNGSERPKATIPSPPSTSAPADTIAVSVQVAPQQPPSAGRGAATGATAASERTSPAPQTNMTDNPAGPAALAVADAGRGSGDHPASKAVATAAGASAPIPSSSTPATDSGSRPHATEPTTAPRPQQPAERDDQQADGGAGSAGAHTAAQAGSSAAQPSGNNAVGGGDGDGAEERQPRATAGSEQQQQQQGLQLEGVSGSGSGSIAAEVLPRTPMPLPMMGPPPAETPTTDIGGDTPMGDADDPDGVHVTPAAALAALDWLPAPMPLDSMEVRWSLSCLSLASLPASVSGCVWVQGGCQLYLETHRLGPTRSRSAGRIVQSSAATPLATEESSSEAGSFQRIYIRTLPRCHTGGTAPAFPCVCRTPHSSSECQRVGRTWVQGEDGGGGMLDFDGLLPESPGGDSDMGGGEGPMGEC